MKLTRAIYTTQHPIAEELIDEWFEDNKDSDVIYFSNNAQMLKLRVEHLKENINIEYFDIKGQKSTILDSGQISDDVHFHFETTFQLAKELAKLCRKRTTEAV